MRTTRNSLALAAALTTLLGSVPATATDDKQLQDIQRQIQALKQDYDGKIKALEDRLQAAEQASKTAETQAAAAQASVAAVAAAPPAPAAANAFNPGIAGVLNGTFGQFSHSTANAGIPGFLLAPGTTPGKRGFSLAESEIALSANIDQALYASLIVTLEPDDTVGVEEGYIQSTSLPWGLTLKAGRFYSGIGYLNEKHSHDWDFIDAPLPYHAMLGDQYGDDGVQVRWLAPTDLYLEFGAEAFRGDAFPAANGPNHGKGAGSLFVHTGGDINESSSWLAGLSYLQTDASDRITGGDSFSGHEHIGIASLVYKWAPQGNPTVHNLILSGEYFRGQNEGSFNGNALSAWQQGWYVQGVYQFMPRWRVGLRHDQLDSQDLGGAFAGTVLDNLGHTPERNSALLEFDTSEFGRLRLQYTRDDSNLVSNDELMFAYTVIFGPHGAHRF